MDYVKILGVGALVVLALVALYVVLGDNDEAVGKEDTEKFSQFLGGSTTDSRTLSKEQLDRFCQSGLVLMRRLPTSADPSMESKAMGYRGRGRGGRGRRGGCRGSGCGGFRRRHGGRGWGPYYRHYYWDYPLYYYDVINPFFYNYANDYCWVRGYDGYMYALQNVNGRCPLDLLV